MESLWLVLLTFFLCVLPLQPKPDCYTMSFTIPAISRNHFNKSFANESEIGCLCVEIVLNPRFVVYALFVILSFASFRSGRKLSYKTCISVLSLHTRTYYYGAIYPTRFGSMYLVFTMEARFTFSEFSTVVPAIHWKPTMLDVQILPH